MTKFREAWGSDTSIGGAVITRRAVGANSKTEAAAGNNFGTPGQSISGGGSPSDATQDDGTKDTAPKLLGLSLGGSGPAPTPGNPTAGALLMVYNFNQISGNIQVGFTADPASGNPAFSGGQQAGLPWTVTQDWEVLWGPAAPYQTAVAWQDGSISPGGTKARLFLYLFYNYLDIDLSFFVVPSTGPPPFYALSGAHYAEERRVDVGAWPNHSVATNFWSGGTPIFNMSGWLI